MRDWRRWLVVGLFVCAEGLVIWTHPQEAKTVMRTVYDTLWKIAPKPDGYEPPQRFR